MSKVGIERDSAVYNAWRSFVANGQIKSDVIGSALAVKWERYRLLGLRASSDLTELPKNTRQNKRSFFADLIAHSEIDTDEYNYSAIIVDDECVIEDVFNIDANLSILAAGVVLRESQTGNLSLYESILNKRTRSVFGSEHYLSQFHDYVDITLPFKFDKKYYYFVVFIPLKQYSEQFLEKTAEDLKRWQMIWKLSNQNNVAPATECLRVTINREAKLLESNDHKNYKIGSCFSERFVDFNFDQLLAEGLLYSEDVLAGQRVVIVLLKQNQASFELAIQRTSSAFEHYLHLDIFNSLLAKQTQHESMNQYVTDFSNQFEPILLIGNQHEALSDGVKAFLNSGYYGEHYFVVDASLYNIKDDSKALKWYRDLSQCCIVLKHVECIDLKQQNDLLQVIRDNIVSLRNNRVQILIVALLQSDRADIISAQIKAYCQNTTINCFKTEHKIAGQLDWSDRNYTLESLSAIEEKAIRNTLLATGGNISKSAKILKIGRTTLHRKIKQYQIDTNMFYNDTI